MVHIVLPETARSSPETAARTVGSPDHILKTTRNWRVAISVDLAKQISEMEDIVTAMHASQGLLYDLIANCSSTSNPRIRQFLDDHGILALSLRGTRSHETCKPCFAMLQETSLGTVGKVPGVYDRKEWLPPIILNSTAVKRLRIVLQARGEAADPFSPLNLSQRETRMLCTFFNYAAGTHIAVGEDAETVNGVPSFRSNYSRNVNSVIAGSPWSFEKHDAHKAGNNQTIELIQDTSYTEE